ncbi:MAG: chromate resistance protein [Deltaproteobacteria bacterium]|nr:MAG: chromate resistance protein [Deltaproteobacteria bacterium]TMB41902.1 MAG: chromate resistance protein [Deltaproteobacteria bacterium]
MWRRLQALGAVAIKNSAYVLPRTDQAREDFEWVLREIIKQGGEASLCEARFVDGLRDDQVEALFNAARDAEYGGIVAEARRVADNLPSGEALPEGRRPQLEAEVARLKRRLAEVSALDFFGAPGREAADGLVASLEARAQRGLERMADGRQLGDLHGRTWVTRKGIHIDRIASAWLIRRFVDPGAAFKFVPARSYRPEPGELRFDMFEAEFTHEGDLCTFEVLLARVRLDDPALRPIAAIVHDIDLKDAKFDRPEAAGIDRLIAGIAMRHRDDEDRLARGAAVFDDLYEYFRRKRA